MFFFLAFLLPCSQACLAACSPRTALTVTASANHGSTSAPHHSSDTVPQGIPEKCPSCGNPVFLKAVSSGAETLDIPGLSLSPIGILDQPILSSLPQLYASALRLEVSALSLRRYLMLSVLRL